MKGLDIKAYTTRFNDLTLLCPTVVTPEYKNIERSVWSLVPQIRGTVLGSLSTTYESVRNLASCLVNNELSRGTANTKVETPKTENNRRKTRGKDSWQSSRRKQGTGYAVTTTTNPAPVHRTSSTGRYPQCK